MNLKRKTGCSHISSGPLDQMSGSSAKFAREWRCRDCGKLLGKENGSQMQIRRKPAEYLVSFPITAKCPGCGSLNVRNKT